MIHRNIFVRILPIALWLLVTSACQPVAAAGPTLLPAPKVDAAKTVTRGDQVAVFAGGCFWGIEAVFQHIKGVTQATAGYSGGSADTAHYAAVAHGDTGHAESVRVHFDPAMVSYGTLLRAFFSVALDPTELNRQGPDSGKQYRSVIFYTNAAQNQIAAAYVAQLTAARSFAAPIVTEVVPLKAFYPAEEYHQNYFENHPDAPYIIYNDAPKVAHLKQLLPDLYQIPEQYVEVQLH